ncbi:SNF2 family N-terminal domain-containing protein [Hypoxylon cercidicola]|nr:SNF2 family N-terminal domain-containing protein [Hypoxylon cercidicola]
MAQPSASPGDDALKWTLELDIADLKAAKKDTTEKEAELNALLLRKNKPNLELSDDAQASTNAVTSPSMSDQLEYLFTEQPTASIAGRKRERSKRDESSTSEPPHKSRRTESLLWDSDDDTEDDDKGVISRPSSMDTSMDTSMGTRMDESKIRDLFASKDSDKEQYEDPEAIQCTLYKHQLIALQWMAKQERDELKRGGILADDMGLGKTLSTIALMVSRKAEHSSQSVKTNLIVAPVALLMQWQREIEQKIKPEHKLSVFVLHGNRKADYIQLRDYDVVLTTYGKLTSEFKRMEEYIKEAKKKKEGTDNDRLSGLCPLTGPLSTFHRIILDEAQCIKNEKSIGAKAASQLKGRYRWCLSGTPMMNGPMEMASLVHFLRIKPYDNINLYKSTFKPLDPKSKSSVGRKRALHILRALLSSIMLRRKKDQLIDGKPIIELKEKVEVVDYAVFDDDELDFYRTLEKKSRVEFSKYYQGGAAGKNITKILILLLRLRQACCHPHLHLLDLETAGPNISDNNMVKTAKSLGPKIVQRTKEAKNFTCSVCADVRKTMNIMSPCGDYVCTPCVEEFMDLAKQQSIEAGNGEGSASKGSLDCPKCKEHSKVVTYDAFTKAHMPQGSASAYVTSDTDDDSSDGDIDDNSNNKANDVDSRGNLKGFVVGDDSDDEYVDDENIDDEDSGEFEDSDMEMEDAPNDEESNDMEERDESKAERKRKYKAKAQPVQLSVLREKGKSSQEAHRRYMKELRRILLPSSKVTKCLEIISTIQKTTGEKIIVFSQWTFLLDILEVSITDQLKIRLCRFDGGMSASQRDNAATEFTTNPDAKVILVSLKAGNAGLNLTAASQVILMDPFWNPYIENQAIDRTYRIGQKKDVTVHRILVKETVEDRIISIQELKRHIVESVLSNKKAAKSVASLGLEELAFIFGMK